MTQKINYLQHGTSSKYLDQILAEGLRPRMKKLGNFTHSIKSARDRIYLTNAYAPYYAQNACRNREDLIIFLYDQEDLVWDLIADEDAIEQCSRGLASISKEEMHRRTKEAIKLAPILSMEGRFTFRESLEYLGTCAHEGPIDKIKLKGYTRLKNDVGLTLRFWDPTITVMNYRIMGEYYRKLSNALWNPNEEIEHRELLESYILERKIF